MDCFSGCVAQSLIIRPSNVAGIKGVTDSLMLRCAIELPVEPAEYSWTESGGALIFNKSTKFELHGHHEKFTLEGTTQAPQWEKYNMDVQTDILDVAGRYQCSAAHAASVYAFADVLLLGMWKS